jgi:hypothetical protein
MGQIIIVILNSPHFRSQILQSSFDLGHKIYSKANIVLQHLLKRNLHNGNKVYFFLVFQPLPRTNTSSAFASASS